MKQQHFNLYKLPSSDIIRRVSVDLSKTLTMFCYRCGKEIHENDIYCSRCGARRSQDYQKEVMAFGSNISEEEAIRYYSNVSYSYNSIIIFLNVYHGISISIPTLKRRLRHYSLRRKQIAFNENIVRGIIEREMQGPRSIKGYKSMYQTLRQSYGVHVPRDNVMHILKEIDPSGTGEWKWKKLKYFSTGPNATWYMDGFDKLKPYGFPIHGCVDGFSRRIMWLKVTRSNNNQL